MVRLVLKGLFAYYQVMPFAVLIWTADRRDALVWQIFDGPDRCQKWCCIHKIMLEHTVVFNPFWCVEFRRVYQPD